MNNTIATKIVNECLKKVQAVSKNSVLADELRKAISSALSQIDVISREDFEAQKRVLQRTQQMVEQLETRVSQLEQRASGKSNE